MYLGFFYDNGDIEVMPIRNDNWDTLERAVHDCCGSDTYLSESLKVYDTDGFYADEDYEDQIDDSYPICSVKIYPCEILTVTGIVSKPSSY